MLKEHLNLELDSRNRVELIVEGLGRGRPTLVLAHGAGNDMRHPFFELMAGGVLRSGIQLIRFNFPYRAAGRRIPDREPVLRKAWMEVVRLVQRRFASGPLFIGGKSMGGRMAAMVAPELAGLKGLVFLGYPLHPPGKPDQLRDAPLFQIRKPMLFIQGEKDRLARLDLLQNVLAQLKGDVQLHVVAQGDHSFKVPRRTERTYEEVLQEVAAEMVEWVLQRSECR